MIPYGVTDTKSKGGRGVKAENKYERLTVTLPPELKTKLDTLASAARISRSEMLVRVIRDHGIVKATNEPVIPVILESSQLQGLMPVKTSKAAEPSTALADSPPGDELAGLTILQVMSSVIPQSLKNRLRWSPERYTELERILQDTKTVRLDKSSGKLVWRVDSGESMRRDTVMRLYHAGVLMTL